MPGFHAQLYPVGKVPSYKGQKYLDEFKEILKEEAEKIDSHFDTIFSGFENTRPEMFTSTVRRFGPDLEIRVYTMRRTEDNMIVSIINWGLGPRDIISKPPKNIMVFPLGYWAATKAGRIYSRRRAKYGPWRRTRHVRRHRIEARRMDMAIAKRRRGYFQKIVQNRVNKMTKGHFKA